MANRYTNGWTLEDIELLKELYPVTKYNELERIFNRSRSAIKTKASGLKLTKALNLYKTSSGTKLLDGSLESLYWIGFILADGHIADRYALNINLARSENHHLEKLAKLLNTKVTFSMGTPSYIGDRYIKAYPKCHLRVRDAKNFKQLQEQFDINSDKSHIPPDFYSYPKFLTSDQILALIIGFTDGDGTVCCNGAKEQRYFNFAFGLHESWLNNLMFIKDFLINYFDIPSDMMPRIKGNGDAYLKISNNNILTRVKQFILKYNLPVLIRKWDKIDENRPNTNEYDDGISIQQIDIKTGQILNTFTSCKEAAKHGKHYNKQWHKTNIKQTAESYPKSIQYGFKWKFVNEKLYDLSTLNDNWNKDGHRSIHQIDKDTGEIIQTYSSIKVAAANHQPYWDSGKLKRAAESPTTRSSYGYRWQFVDNAA